MAVHQLPKVGGFTGAESATSSNAVHPGPSAPAGHPASSSISGDTTKLAGQTRGKSSLYGGDDAEPTDTTPDQDKEAEDSVKSSLETHKSKFDELQKDLNLDEGQFEKVTDRVKKFSSSVFSNGKRAGVKAEQGSLMWKVPLTLLSGVALGLIPAWAIASKDDKTMKQLREQLAAAQTQ